MESIISIATQHFFQFGFKNVTVDEIARKCGISKKTLYETFKNKEELVFTCVKEYNLVHWTEMEKITKESKNAVEEIVGTFFHMSKMFKGINPICFLDLQRYYTKAFQFMEEFKQTKLINCIEDNLIRGKAEGLYREDIDVEILSLFRLESIFMTMHLRSFNQASQNLVHINQEIFKLFMYGLATIKGHKLITKHIEKSK